jgi:hypothetical protein
MADPQRVVEARRVLAQLGVTFADLQTAGAARVEIPTVAQYRTSDRRGRAGSRRSSS